MTVLCPRKMVAYQQEADALAACRTNIKGAHRCPICEYWHAGPLYTHCPSRKVPYASKSEAQTYAARMNARPDGYGTNYPYECPTCGQWHVGRPHKGKTLQ